jgi:hypothetical protein
MDPIKEILVRFFVAILCGGSIFGLLVGVGLLLKPERIVFLNQYFSRWFSAEQMTEQLDRPRSSERFLYRHHRLLGGGLFVGALFILYIFLFSYNVRRISIATASGYWVVMDVLVAILVVGAALAGLVGIIVAARPSLLREIEKSTNRWIATDGIVKFFNSMRYSPDQHILRGSKAAGVIIIASSVYILIVLGPFLLRAGWKF